MSLRKRLYSRSRPRFRQIAESDIALLVYAWKRGAFDNLQGLSDEHFVATIRNVLASFTEVFLAEDKTSVFTEGRGPIGLVGIRSNGWQANVSTEPFPWITALQMLSSMVSFFHMMRYSKTYGVVVAVTEDNGFYDRLGRYTSIKRAGEIQFGTPRGPEYIYSMRTAKNGRTQRLDGVVDPNGSFAGWGGSGDREQQDRV